MTKTLFNFGRSNRLSLVSVVDDHDFDQMVGYWLSGRIVGRYVAVMIPWRKRLDEGRVTP